jgi:hypothetical protein
VFDQFLGLPLHALVVHAVVAFVPLSALIAIGYAVRPGWRRVLRWPTVAGAVVSGATAYVAAQSGQALLLRVSQVRASTTNFDLLQQHQTWGDRAKWLCLVFMVLTLALVWFARPPEEESPRGHPIDVILAVLVVIAAVTATTTVVLAGHAGAQVVWDGLF